MARMIDADAFLKDILTAGIGKTIIEYSESDIAYMIRKRPTVDAVEVVRCRDCKHRGTDYCISHIKGEPADEELLRKLDNDLKGKTMYKWICPVCGERIWNCPYCFRCGTRLEDVKNDKERGN